MCIAPDLIIKLTCVMNTPTNRKKLTKVSFFCFLFIFTLSQKDQVYGLKFCGFGVIIETDQMIDLRR